MNRLSEHERLSVVVHELRSPVAALGAIAEFLSSRESDVSDRRSLVTLAVSACRAIGRIVGDSAITSVRREPLDVARLVTSAVAAARLTGSSLRLEIGPEVPLVAGDPVRLRQALDDLLTNAVSHTSGAGEVVVTVQAGDDKVIVSVADEGPGIALADQERIFERGVRLGADRPGSGLGLPIARAIAEAHDGSLTVESTPGKGATFRLVLPRRR